MKIFRIVVTAISAILSVFVLIKDGDIITTSLFLFPILLSVPQIFFTANHKRTNLVLRIVILIYTGLMFLLCLNYISQSGVYIIAIFFALYFIAFLIEPTRLESGTKENNNIRNRWWLIAWIVSLLVFSFELVLLILKVGTVGNRPSGWVIIPLLISPICFLVSLSVWLIAKLKKWAIIPFILIVAIVGFGIYSYEQTINQEKEVCKTVLKNESKNAKLYSDFQKENSQLTADTTDVEWSYSQVSKVLSDYKSLQKTSDEEFKLMKEDLDIYLKYVNQFMGFLNPPKDLNAKYKTIQDAQMALDQYYKANIDYLQAVLDMKPLSELQLLIKNINETGNKTSEVGKNSNFDAMVSVQNEIYSMCSQL